MKKLILVLLLLVCPALSQGQTTLVHHYLPTLSLAQANSYVGYDAIVIDPEVPFSSPEALDWLAKQNPKIKVICYFNLPEWFNPMFSDKPWGKKVVDFLNQIPEWWLKGANGKRISFWPGMQTMNCSITCPRVMIDGQKQNYIEFMTQVFLDNILKQYKFQGVLLDNCWQKAFWLGRKNKAGVDIDGDHKADDSIKVDRAWKKGMELAIKRIKAASDNDFIIIGNPGSAPFEISTMFEDFPLTYANEKDRLYQGWYENMNLASSRAAKNRLIIFNSRKDNYWFSLCSTMLLDNIYFSYVQNSPYEKKWQLNLGQPLGPASISDGEHCRQYQKGTVYVDPLKKTARVIYVDGTIRNK